MNYTRIGINYIYIILLKIRYKGRCEIAARQMFGNGIKIRCVGTGRIRIGSTLYTRDDVFLMADDGQIVIGNYVFMNRNVSITSKESVIIGDNVTIANNVVIVDHDHKKNSCADTETFITKPVQIKENVWIGANAVILKGVRIGKNAVVAAGSVVTKDVEENSFVAGVPAKKIN